MARKTRIDEPVTDVLAAEEFGVPAPDPALHHEKLELPTDLVGEEPRDVLAAEEFAMPAPDEARVHLRGSDDGADAERTVVLRLWFTALLLLVIAVALAGALRRRRGLDSDET
jgi:hypothetical protein